MFSHSIPFLEMALELISKFQSTGEAFSVAGRQEYARGQQLCGFGSFLPSWVPGIFPDLFFSQVHLDPTADNLNLTCFTLLSPLFFRVTALYSLSPFPQPGGGKA